MKKMNIKIDFRTFYDIFDRDQIKCIDSIGSSTIGTNTPIISCFIDKCIYDLKTNVQKTFSKINVLYQNFHYIQLINN